MSLCRTISYVSKVCTNTMCTIKDMTPYKLFNILHTMGLYETLCFRGTTKITYVFIEDGRLHFKNRRGTMDTVGSILWKIGLTLYV